MTIKTHFKPAHQIESELANFNFGRLEISENLEAEILDAVRNFKTFCNQSPNHKNMFDGNFYHRFAEEHNNREIAEIYLDSDLYLKDLNLKLPDMELIQSSKNLLAEPEIISLNAQIGDYFSEICESSIFHKYCKNENNWKLKFVHYPVQPGYLHAFNLLRTGYSVILHQSSRDLKIFIPNKEWEQMQYGENQIAFFGGLKTQYLSNGLITAPNFMVPGSKESLANGRICLQLENTFRFDWPKKEFKVITLPPGRHYGWGKKELEPQFGLNT